VQAHGFLETKVLEGKKKPQQISDYSIFRTIGTNTVAPKHSPCFRGNREELLSVGFCASKWKLKNRNGMPPFQSLRGRIAARFGMLTKIALR